MARTKARGGFGSLLQRGDGATPTEAFTTIGEITDIKGGGDRTRDFGDATHMESPDGYMEEVPLIKKAGPITIELNDVPTDGTQRSMEDDFEAGTLRNFRLVYPSATGKRREFAAYIASISDAKPVNGKMTLTIGLNVQGKSTLVAHP